jgi:Tfp pilus assembly protein PilF
VKSKHVVLGLILICALALPAAAQQLIFKGKIVGPDGNPMKDAKVNMTNIDNGTKRTLKTDKKGEFFQLGVDDAKYDVEIVDPQGQTMWKSKIVVSIQYPDMTTELDLNFKTGEGMVTQPEGPRKFQIGGGNQNAQNQPTTGGQPTNNGAPPGMVPNPALTPEQRAKIEDIQKKKAAWEQVNAKFKAANDAEVAGQIDQAIALYKEANAIDPTYWQIWRNLAMTQMHAKQFADAEQSFTKALELVQNDPKKDPVEVAAMQHNLGAALIDENKVDEAIPHYKESIAGDPTHAAKYSYDLGVVLAHKSGLAADPAKKAAWTKEANDAFDHALQLDPNMADAYFQKGLMGFQDAKIVGKKMVVPPGTEEALQKYLELQPTGPNATLAKQYLDAIGSTIKGGYSKKP